jgi:hypothetical protein
MWREFVRARLACRAFATLPNKMGFVKPKIQGAARKKTEDFVQLLSLKAFEDV